MRGCNFLLIRVLRGAVREHLGREPKKGHLDNSADAFQVNNLNHSAQGSASPGEAASELPAEDALRGLIFRAQDIGK